MTSTTSEYPLEQRVAAYIADNSLLPPGARIVVGLSGGADSVALLSVLHALGYDCLAAHCNFHLRGDESQRDMRHAQAVADSLNVDISVKNFNTARYAALTGISIEMAARQQRYEWFTDLLEREHAAAIAVAHHRNDQIETFFLNMLRGSGLRGLAAMAPRNGHVIRPMLDITRTEIEEYLTARGLSYVTDSTNADSEFRRNRLRNKVIPEFTRHFPEMPDAALETIKNIRSNLALYDYAVQRLTDEFTADNATRIDIAAMQRIVPQNVAKTLLYEILRPRGFNASQAADILRAQSGATFQAGAYVASLGHGVLEISSALNGGYHPAEVPVSLLASVTEPIHIEVTRHHISEFRPERDPSTIYLDARVLEADRRSGDMPRFVLRPWRVADRMSPYGLDGTKLVSDIYAEAHLSATDKKRRWLLVRNNTILWAVGLRASSHFPVTPRTRTYLRLRLL